MAFQETPVILPGHDFETVTETVAEIPADMTQVVIGGETAREISWTK